ncbi:MAG TPA: TIM barrel protein [Candidatus Hydrogenedentes bacterium]|nr:TIM barrel protein [Candidatus Hydrogenedentota bacterium]HPG67114.1 TIM barrel protein [Candidatus Hydrogenedentota bacterium]
MTHTACLFSVFTKPWTMALPELGEHVAGLGFDGIELPVRPGYPIDPERVKALPEAARTLAGFGLQVFSVAGPTDESTIAACAEAGVPVIRICPVLAQGAYMLSEARLRKDFDALVPLLDKYGVKIGLQNHCGHHLANNAMGQLHILEHYDPKHFVAVWDAAHNALGGEEPESAIDILWPYLDMVNLKNAYYQRINGFEAEVAEWRSYWTSGRQGLASWPRVARELRRREWSGVVCLTAEYSDHDSADRLIAEDIAFAKSLFEGKLF